MTENTNENRIVITNDDLNSTVVQEQVRQMEEAKKMTLVRSVGAPTKSNAGAIAILILTIGGVAAGIIAFLLQRIAFSTVLTDVSTTVSNLSFTFILAFGIGLVVTLVDAISTRVGSKVLAALAIAIPTSVLSGLAIGAIANFFYSNIMQGIWEQANTRYQNGQSEESVYAWVRNMTHLPRGFAWLIVGLAAGLTVGVASKSLKRTGLTLGGGAIGGFVGGFIFDFFPQGLEWVSQLAGIAITGLLIGLAMGLLEQAARTQWIEVTVGGMAGKQFILYKRDLTIGSSPQADITLIKDSAILPIHARIFAQGGRSYIESLDPGNPCKIGGRTEIRMALEDSTDITLGGTQIRFREKAGATQAVGSVGRLA